MLLIRSPPLQDKLYYLQAIIHIEKERFIDHHKAQIVICEVLGG